MPYFPPSSAVIGASNANDLISNNYRLFDNALQAAVRESGANYRMQQQNMFNTMQAAENLKLGLTPAGNYQADFKPSLEGVNYMQGWLENMLRGQQLVPQPGYAVWPGYQSPNGKIDMFTPSNLLFPGQQ